MLEHFGVPALAVGLATCRDVDSDHPLPRAWATEIEASGPHAHAPERSRDDATDHVAAQHPAARQRHQRGAALGHHGLADSVSVALEGPHTSFHGRCWCPWIRFLAQAGAKITTVSLTRTAHDGQPRRDGWRDRTGLQQAEPARWSAASPWLSATTRRWKTWPTRHRQPDVRPRIAPRQATDPRSRRLPGIQFARTSGADRVDAGKLHRPEYTCAGVLHTGFNGSFGETLSRPPGPGCGPSPTLLVGAEGRLDDLGDGHVPAAGERRSGTAHHRRALEGSVRASWCRPGQWIPKFFSPIAHARCAWTAHPTSRPLRRLGGLFDEAMLVSCGTRRRRIGVTTSPDLGATQASKPRPR